MGWRGSMEGQVPGEPRASWTPASRRMAGAERERGGPGGVERLAQVSGTDRGVRTMGILASARADAIW